MTLLQAAHGVTPAKRCHYMTTVFQRMLTITKFPAEAGDAHVIT